MAARHNITPLDSLHSLRSLILNWIDTYLMTDPRLVVPLGLDTRTRIFFFMEWRRLKI